MVVGQYPVHGRRVLHWIVSVGQAPRVVAYKVMQVIAVAVFLNQCFYLQPAQVSTHHSWGQVTKGRRNLNTDVGNRG